MITRPALAQHDAPQPGGSSHRGEQDLWNLVRFIRHFPQLTEEREMQSLIQRVGMS
jgi:hypothetical protein